MCNICIVTFSGRALSAVLDSYNCAKIAEMQATYENVPYYALNYKGADIAFYKTMPGSAAAAACLEEASCMIGAEKFIVFGSCGCLDREVAAGKIIIPTQAYRDEGVSYHYAEAADYIKLNNADKVAAFMRQAGIPHVTGKTWTTDAIYREPRTTCSGGGRRAA